MPKIFKHLTPRVLLLFSGLLFFVPVFAQTTELGISLNSGLFSFSGRSAASNSFMNYSSASTAYTNDPYGTRPGVSYGISLNIKRIIRRHVLVGVDAGYEVLRSVVRLDWISMESLNLSYALTAHGQTILSSHFIDLSPFAGYRFSPGKVSVDLTGGIDLADCLSARETGVAEGGNGKSYLSSLNRKTISFDLRPRLQVTAGYRRTTVSVGYSLGLRNYMAGYIGGVNDAYARLFRFGVGYRLF